MYKWEAIGMNGMDLRKNRLDRAAFLLIALSAVFLTSFVCPYAPYFRYCFETDESVYRILSLGWLRGKLPYRDLFDHKGPLTYVFYALGLLLSGQKNWGMWIVFCIVNAITFTTMYKIFRLYYSEKISMASSSFLLFILTFFKDSIFGSASKPENILVMFLMLSSYLFARAVRDYSVKDPEEKKSAKVFSIPDMIKLGLYCGCVFMIKFNVCIFYLCFLGAYFLWLLIRKNFSEFFSRAVIFLGGIAAITGIFVIYYAAMGGLSDFIDTYFGFNLRYGGKSDWIPHYMRYWIPFSTQAVTTILILLSAATFYLGYKAAKDGKKQKLVHFILGVIIYIFVTSPAIYYYTFIVLLPIYMYGIPFPVEILLNRSKDSKLGKAAIVSFFAVPVLIAFLVNVLIMPSIPWKTIPFEEKMNEYADSHPHATYMFFLNSKAACPMFYDLTTEVPNFKYFFMPPRSTEEMEFAQMVSIGKGEPDVIVVPNPQDQDEEIMQDFYDLFESCGYKYFCEGDGYAYSQYYLIYVKSEG